MRRTSADNESSLDLFLDTITNTFGGLLFLAVLVVLLLQMTQQRQEEAPHPPPPADLSPLRDRLVEVSAELASLQKAVAMQQSLAETLATAEQLDALRTLREREQRHEQLVATRLDALRRLSEQQAEINGISRQIADLDAALAAAEESLREAQQQVNLETDKKSRSSQMPEARTTTKGEVAVVLRYGRLYLVYEAASYPYPRRLNTEHMLLMGETPVDVRATPKPYAGLPIAEGPVFRQELGTLLGPLDPQRYYLGLAIWSDSFTEFATVRSALIDLEFEYRLVPIPPGCVFSEIGAANPLVQ